MSSPRVIFAALVIFIAGLVTGRMTSDLGRKYPARSGEPERTRAPWSPERIEYQQREMLRRMERQLGLSAEQRTQITGILRDGHGRIRKIWEEVAPETQSEFREIRSQLRAVLSPGQQKRFDELFKARPISPDERAFRDDGRRGPGGGHPPEGGNRRRPGKENPTNTILNLEDGSSYRHAPSDRPGSAPAENSSQSPASTELERPKQP